VSSAPARWLSAGEGLPPEGGDEAMLPPASGAAPSPTLALPPGQPTVVPPGIHGPPTGARSIQSLPLQPGGAAARRAQFATAQPSPAYQMQPHHSPQRELGAVEHDFGGHMLGFSTIAVAMGAVVGTRYGGMYGGIAGSLFGGSLVNVYRSVRFAIEGNKDADREAIISGTYALVAAGFGGVVLYKLDKKGRAKKNPASPKCRSNGSSGCGFRPVGP